jgi:hypothetical protein
VRSIATENGNFVGGRSKYSRALRPTEDTWNIGESITTERLARVDIKTQCLLREESTMETRRSKRVGTMMELCQYAYTAARTVVKPPSSPNRAYADSLPYTTVADDTLEHSSMTVGVCVCHEENGA